MHSGLQAHGAPSKLILSGGWTTYLKNVSSSFCRLADKEPGVAQARGLPALQAAGWHGAMRMQHRVRTLTSRAFSTMNFLHGTSPFDRCIDHRWHCYTLPCAVQHHAIVYSMSSRRACRVLPSSSHHCTTVWHLESQASCDSPKAHPSLYF